MHICLVLNETMQQTALQIYSAQVQWKEKDRIFMWG